MVYLMNDVEVAPPIIGRPIVYILFTEKMIDDSKVFRGACGSCECAEFVLGKVTSKCDDCACPTSKHREQEKGKLRL